MIDKDMKRKDLQEMTGISYATISKLTNGENVTMEVIEKVCTKLKCGVENICEFVPDEDN